MFENLGYVYLKEPILRYDTISFSTVSATGNSKSRGHVWRADADDGDGERGGEDGPRRGGGGPRRSSLDQPILCVSGARQGPVSSIRRTLTESHNSRLC